MLQSESISNGISSKGEHMKNRPGLKQYIFAALGVVILVLLDLLCCQPDGYAGWENRQKVQPGNELR